MSLAARTDVPKAARMQTRAGIGLERTLAKIDCDEKPTIRDITSPKYLYLGWYMRVAVTAQPNMNRNGAVFVMLKLSTRMSGAFLPATRRVTMADVAPIANRIIPIRLFFIALSFVLRFQSSSNW